LRHERHHVVVVVAHVHVGENGVWAEEILVDAEAVGENRGSVSEWNSHIHGCVGLSIAEFVLVLVGRDIDGVEVAKGVCAWSSSRERTVGEAILEGLLLILPLLVWHPEAGDEFFEISRVSVSNLLEEKSVLTSIKHVHAVVRALVHVVVHVVVHQIAVAAVAIEDAGQGLLGKGIHVDLITTRFELVVTVVVIDYVHHSCILLCL